jgi:beta-N-acetylhexosaminidase
MLHLALWNPYANLDVAAPALMSFGYRPPALRALVALLRGELAATGQRP